MRIDRNGEEVLETMGTRIAKGGAKGGWYYQAKTGNICAYLGKAYPPEYAQF